MILIRVSQVQIPYSGAHQAVEVWDHQVWALAEAVGCLSLILSAEEAALVDLASVALGSEAAASVVADSSLECVLSIINLLKNEENS